MLNSTKIVYKNSHLQAILMYDVFLNMKPKSKIDGFIGSQV